MAHSNNKWHCGQCDQDFDEHDKFVAHIPCKPYPEPEKSEEPQQEHAVHE